MAGCLLDSHNFDFTFNAYSSTGVLPSDVDTTGLGSIGNDRVLPTGFYKVLGDIAGDLQDEHMWRGIFVKQPEEELDDECSSLAAESCDDGVEPIVFSPGQESAASGLPSGPRLHSTPRRTTTAPSSQTVILLSILPFFGMRPRRSRCGVPPNADESWENPMPQAHDQAGDETHDARITAPISRENAEPWNAATSNVSLSVHINESTRAQEFVETEVEDSSSHFVLSSAQVTHPDSSITALPSLKARRPIAKPRKGRPRRALGAPAIQNPSSSQGGVVPPTRPHLELGSHKVPDEIVRKLFESEIYTKFCQAYDKVHELSGRILTLTKAEEQLQRNRWRLTCNYLDDEGHAAAKGKQQAFFVCQNENVLSCGQVCNSSGDMTRHQQSASHVQQSQPLTCSCGVTLKSARVDDHKRHWLYSCPDRIGISETPGEEPVESDSSRRNKSSKKRAREAESESDDDAEDDEEDYVPGPSAKRQRIH
ncbi:hypothetical protein BDZ97DRAFT_1761022 [Flammula alnicola]|nr:hypothetical protein BDZ97DRAFT_1761022 [Flammula alnicola]